MRLGVERPRRRAFAHEYVANLVEERNEFGQVGRFKQLRVLLTSEKLSNSGEDETPCKTVFSVGQVTKANDLWPKAFKELALGKIGGRFKRAATSLAVIKGLRSGNMVHRRGRVEVVSVASGHVEGEIPRRTLTASRLSSPRSLKE